MGRARGVQDTLTSLILRLAGAEMSAPVTVLVSLGVGWLPFICWRLR